MHLAIRAKRPETDRKHIFLQIKMIEKQSQNVQQRKMVLLNYLHTLENALSDEQMLETVSNFGKII